MTTEKILTVTCVFTETKLSDMFPISEFAFNQRNKYIFYIKSEHGNRKFASIRVDPLLYVKTLNLNAYMCARAPPPSTYIQSSLISKLYTEDFFGTIGAVKRL